MALQIFDKSNSFNRRGKPAIINLDKEGRINFSVAAVKILRLHTGLPISFAFDDADKEIIYFYKDENGIALQESFTKAGTQRLHIYCRPLAEKLLKFFKYNNNHSFSVTDKTVKVDGKQMWFFLKYTS